MQDKLQQKKVFPRVVVRNSVNYSSRTRRTIQYNQGSRLRGNRQVHSAGSETTQQWINELHRFKVASHEDSSEPCPSGNTTNSVFGLPAQIAGPRRRSARIVHKTQDYPISIPCYMPPKPCFHTLSQFQAEAGQSFRISKQ